MHNHKGMEAFLAVPIGLAFIIIIAFGLKAVGNVTLIQSHILVEQTFAFESSFGTLVNQVNQLLSIKNPDNFPGELRLPNKKIDKLSYWLAFYAHANKTNSNIKYNVTDPNSAEISLEDANVSITAQLNETAHAILSTDIFYSLLFADIVVNQIPDRKIQTFGRAILPIPIPGDEIKYFKFGREETNYNLVLSQKERD